MLRKKVLILLLNIIALACCTGLIHAMVSAVVTNPFVTGIVDIELTEYQKVGDQEVFWVDNPTIIPGDVVSKIPRIHNDGNDCYIRAKITFRETDDLDDKDLLGISEDWYKADDGYYYYKKILPHGGDTDIFQAVAIPKDFPQEREGEQFFIDIEVDAIQSQNFTPVWDRAQPWGSVEILDCEKEGQYEIVAVEPSEAQSFKVVYQGDAQKLITNSDSFFANFPVFMPGDVFSEAVSLVNDGDKDIVMHFRSVALDDSELLEKIGLKITTIVDGKTAVFYEGNLKALDLAEDKILAQIPAGASAEFNFEVSVPAELNNPYSISASAVQWIFSTKVTDNPQTGDFRPIGAMVCGLIVSVVGCWLLVSHNKRKKEETKDE